MNTLNGWSIGIKMFSYIWSNFEESSTILEFGAGTGTITLAKCFNVISIEHNEKWIGLSDKAKYYHAPLQNDWYNVEVVEKAIANKKIDLIIIDGPPGEGKRDGVYNFIKKNPILKSSVIIVDDTNRQKERELSIALSKLVERHPTQFQDYEKTFDLI